MAEPMRFFIEIILDKKRGEEYAGVMALDVKIFYFLNNLAGQSRIFDWLIIFFAAELQYILVALFAAFLLWTKMYSLGEKMRIFWVALIAVVISRLVITGLIRFFYERPRPFLVSRVHQLIAENSHSFPSGHATFFFALATAVYFYNKRWGLWFFAASIVMGAARVMAGVHYPSDVLGGALIGIASGYIVYKIAERLKNKAT